MIVKKKGIVSTATVQIQPKEEYKMEYKYMAAKHADTDLETKVEQQNTLTSGMILYFINKQ